MIANNVFKFVSVRPADLQTGGDPAYVQHAAQDEVVARLRQELPQHHGMLDQARLKLGADMIADPAYYATESTWKKLRLVTSAIAQLLADTAKDPNLNNFKQAVTALLDVPLGGGLDIVAFVASQQFKDLLKTLWRSYYAVVLNPVLRPQDRHEIGVWIQLFSVLAVINDQAAFKKTAKEAPEIRPGVPIEFYRMKLEGQPAPGQPEPKPAPDPGADRVNQAKADLAALEAARTLLAELHATKLRAFQDMVAKPGGHAPPPPPANGVAARAQGRAGAKVRIATEIDLLQRAPWRLSAADLQQVAPHADALRRAGLDPRVTKVPELIHGVEQRMAAVQAELADLEARPSVSLAGLTPVRVRQ